LGAACLSTTSADDTDITGSPQDDDGSGDNQDDGGGALSRLPLGKLSENQRCAPLSRHTGGSDLATACMLRVETSGRVSDGGQQRNGDDMGVAVDSGLLQMGELSDSSAKMAALQLADGEELDVRVSSKPESREQECVITQVTCADGPQTIRRPNSVHGPDPVGGPDGGAFGWRRKFRNLLCCLAPGMHADRYFRARTAEGESVSAVARFPPVPEYPGWVGEAVLPPLDPADHGKKTLVLDLDETLVHSSFKPVPHADYVIPVEIDGKSVDVYVQKRPYLEEFMARIAPVFEVVVFTASLGKYADPLMDQMDKLGHIKHRLFREACAPFEGNYVKDLKCLGRKLEDVIIVDNSPHSYVFQPENAVPIGTFIDNLNDEELMEILPILTAASGTKDVRQLLPLRTGVGSVMGLR